MRRLYHHGARQQIHYPPLIVKWDKIRAWFDMREITPSFFPDLEKHVEGQVLRKTAPFPIQSYHELVRKVAQLSFLNKDYLLFFRGQDQDYQNKAESSTFYPTIYRKEILTSQEIRSRFELLEVATNKLLEAFDREKLDGRVDIRRKQYIAWSILQHYGVCDTPLLDLTQSLRVAATFAQLGNKADRGMVYVFGLPYTTNRITYNSEQDLVIVRLLSICPPEALRPYFQEGYLCGTLDITDTYTNKSELDFKNRLIAKFSIPTAASFWGSGFSRIPKNLLFPENDLIEAICIRIREEIISDMKSIFFS